MHFYPQELAALIAVMSFAAGLNVYATVASLGLLSRFGTLALPPQLHALGSWYVIFIASVLFAIEFFADKIPAFDIVWNALHTFIRIPVAALLAYQATAGLPVWEQAAATTAGSLIAFAAHGGKMAARIAVIPSPEPVSNVALSFSEDAFVLFITWFVTKHPYVAATIVLGWLIVIILFVRWVIHAFKRLFHRKKSCAVTA